MPELVVGQGRYVAVDPTTSTLGLPPVFNVLSGSFVDLSCAPRPGSDSDESRFPSHGDYVNAWVRHVNDLLATGLILEADAEALKDRAAQSSVGRPGSC